jgi:hypothetical protein
MILRKELTCLVRQGQGKTGRGHLTDHLSVPIVLKWDELLHFLRRTLDLHIDPFVTA